MTQVSTISTLDALLALFEERFALKPGQVTRDKSFMQMGADSLSLLQISLLLKQRFGVNIPFRLLFDELSTPAAVAAYIEKSRPVATEPSPITEKRNGSQVGNPAVGPVAPLASALGDAGLPPPPEAKQEAYSVQTAPSAWENGQETAVETVWESGQDVNVQKNNGALERVILQQLAMMSQQLEFIRSRREHPSPARASDSGRGRGPAPVPAGEASPPDSSRIEAQLPAPPTPVALETRSPNDPDPYGAHKPIKISGQALSESQAQYVRSLVARLSARTAASKALAERHRPHHADSRSTAGFRKAWKEQVYPLCVKRAEGALAWDLDGNEYVDLAMGFGALLFGHSPSFMMEALSEQVKAGIRLGWESEVAGQVAKAICELTGVERVAFCNSGTEAVMTALRLARAVTGREKIAMFEGTYHGTFDGVLVRGNRFGDGRIQAAPMAPGVPRSIVEDMRLLRLNDPRSLDLLREEGREMAAILIEPSPSRQPDLKPRQFIERLRGVADESGAALIFDEVITGFRWHPGGAQALYEVQADLVTYGKALGAGLPVAAVAGRAKYLDAVDGGGWRFGDDSFPGAEMTYFAGTHFKHPMIMGAVWRAINHIKMAGPELSRGLERRTAELVRRLNRCFQEEGSPFDAVHDGSLFRFRYPRGQDQFEIFYYGLLEQGVYIPETRSCFLSTAHGEAEIERVYEAVREVTRGMREAGFFQTGAAVTGEVRPSRETGRELPLTESQKDLWLSGRIFEDGDAAYNLAAGVNIRGRLDTAALRKALQELVNRHEALRITFSADGQTQRLAERSVLELTEVELCEEGAAASEAAVRQWAEAEASRPFDLATGPLIRARMARISPEEWLLVLTTHHVVTDGWSNGVLLRDLGTLYGAARAGRPAALPDAPRFSDFVLKEQAGSQREEDERYWLEQLGADPPVLELPLSFARTTERSLRAETYRMRSDAALPGRIKSMCAELGCTQNAALLAAFAAMLSRVSSESDLIIGSAAAGQAGEESPDLIGYCLNVLPLRCRVGLEDTFEELVDRLQLSLLGAYERRNCSIGALSRKPNLRRDATRLPLVNVAFNLDRGSADLGWLGLKTEVITLCPAAAPYELLLNVTLEADGATSDFTYHTTLFDAETIRRWGGYFDLLLFGMLEDPKRRVGEVSLLGPEERSQ